MPAVVYQQPNSLGLMFGGLTGAFQGQTEVNKFNEEKRQFDEQQKLREAQLAEQQAEWDSDMEYRYNNLKQLAMDNQLNRDQAERFAIMQDSREKFMQQRGFDFQENVVNPFERKNLELSLAEQNIENRRTTNATNYATKKRWEADMEGLASQRDQMVSSEGWKLSQTQSVLNGKSFNTMTPEEQRVALETLTKTILGRGRSDGAPGTAVPTANEQNTAYQEANRLLTNYESRWSTYVDNMGQIATATSIKSQGSDGPAGQLKGSQLVLMPTANAGDMHPWESEDHKRSVLDFNEAFGVPPRVATTVPKQDLEVEDQILSYLAGTVDQINNGTIGYTPDQYAYALKDRMESDVKEMVSKMVWNDKTVQKYYTDMVDHIIYTHIQQQTLGATPIPK